MEKNCEIVRIARAVTNALALGSSCLHCPSDTGEVEEHRGLEC